MTWRRIDPHTVQRGTRSHRVRAILSPYSAGRLVYVEEERMRNHWHRTREAWFPIVRGALGPGQMLSGEEVWPPMAADAAQAYEVLRSGQGLRVTFASKTSTLCETDPARGERRELTYYAPGDGAFPPDARASAHLQWLDMRGSLRSKAWRTQQNVLLTIGPRGELGPYGALEMPAFDVIVDIDRMWGELRKRMARAVKRRPL